MASYYSNNRANKKNIFISYRVQDTAGETGRLVDSLKQHFYEDQIFMDIDRLEPGVDFTEVIAKSLESCDVMLAVIGPNWLGSKNADGVTRINTPNDWVRLELATALKRNIRIVPVLVDGASLPEESELPQELTPLLRRQAHELTNKRWKYDTDQLVSFLERSAGIPTKRAEVVMQSAPRTSAWSVIGIIAGLFVVGLIVVLVWVAGQESNTYPTGSQVDKQNTYAPVDKSPSNTESESESIREETVAIPNQNVEGTWVDANGQYYLVFTQDGNDLDIWSYNLAGQNTGQGSGNVNGNEVRFKISVTNFGIISAQSTVSNGIISGTTSIENNGATYTEPLRLIRR